MRRPSPTPLVLLAALSFLDASAAPPRTRSAVPYGAALVPGDKVPEVSGTTLDGKEAVVSYGAAKLTIVNFWATWCVPCRQEMPELEKLRATHEKRGLQVVGALLYDESTPEQVQEVLADTAVRYRILAVPPGATNAWGGLTLVPTTFLVDAEGRLVRKFVGTDEEGTKAMARDVADYLAGRPLGNPYIPPPAK